MSERTYTYEETIEVQFTWVPELEKWEVTMVDSSIFTLGEIVGSDELPPNFSTP